MEGAKDTGSRSVPEVNIKASGVVESNNMAATQ
jgi:hypothetical protein